LSSVTACGPANRRAAKAVAQAIKKNKLELVRFSFADQHGVLRGKTVMAADVPAR
jgi:glutamine synthetase